MGNVRTGEYFSAAKKDKPDSFTGNGSGERMNNPGTEVVKKSILPSMGVGMSRTERLSLCYKSSQEVSSWNCNTGTGLSWLPLGASSQGGGVVNSPGLLLRLPHDHRCRLQDSRHFPYLGLVFL